MRGCSASGSTFGYLFLPMWGPVTVVMRRVLTQSTIRILLTLSFCWSCLAAMATELKKQKPLWTNRQEERQPHVFIRTSSLNYYHRNTIWSSGISCLELSGSMCRLFSPGCDSHSTDSTVQVTEVKSCHANIYCKYLRNEDVSFQVVLYFIFHCWQTMIAFHITTLCWVRNPALLRNAEPTKSVTNRKPILS